MGAYNSDEIKSVIEEYGDTVYKMALIQGKNTEAAAKIYQAVFIKLAKNKERLPAGETERRWLLKETVKCDIRRRGFQSAGAITECVQKLPEKTRAIFHLSVYEGYKRIEIAELVNLSEQEVVDCLEHTAKKMPEIMAFERVREPENYLERYREEQDAVKHDSLLNEKIYEKADKKSMSRKKLLARMIAVLIALFCVDFTWDYLALYIIPGSFTYIIDTMDGVKVELDEVAPIEFPYAEYTKSGQNWRINSFDTYTEFTEFTGLELFGAGNIEYKDLYAYVKRYESYEPVSKSNPFFSSGKNGSVYVDLEYQNEEYRLYTYFKIKGFTPEDAKLKVNKKKANYAYEYAEGKFAYFICTWFWDSPPFSQDVYFVEDGVMYCIKNIDATWEGTEKVKDILDMMAGE